MAGAIRVDMESSRKARFSEKGAGRGSCRSKPALLSRRSTI
jgi:hypothetical protein